MVADVASISVRTDPKAGFKRRKHVLGAIESPGISIRPFPGWQSHLVPSVASFEGCVFLQATAKAGRPGLYMVVNTLDWLRVITL